MTKCPDSISLQQFLQGSLVQVEFDAIAPHIDTCLACQRKLTQLAEELSDPSSGFAGNQTRPNEQDGLPSQFVERLVGKLAEQTAEGDDASRSQIGGSALTEPPAQLGPYHLKKTIGEGGMGIVYLAEQLEPVKRQVALKIIKPGRDSGEVLARFEAERQALAMMDHPNIASVFDAGATETGLPYFVMELVQGRPVTEFCDTKKLNTIDRLRLFVDVCKAIQHAHQKGIIHRDIKPSNVLVSQSDGKNIVKVIDFGLAKATQQALTDRSFQTQLTQILGTPLYMSPEQVDVGSSDIDTRTDIYSLGVLLYELLTGCTPVDKQKFQQVSYDEMRRIICEEEPSKPSTRVSSVDATASNISANRQSVPRRLSDSLRGDLDWIVMKALEKDRDRRYETANGFADDIDRFLKDEPVLASPPSRRYKIQKFVRRNRVAVIAGSLVVSALLLGVIGTTIGMIWALSERDRANNAVVAEKAAKEEVAIRAAAETKAKEEVQRRANELEQVSKFQASQLSDIDANKMGLDLRNGLLAEVRAALERSKMEPTEIAASVKQLDQRLAGANFTNLSLKTLDANVFQRAMAAIDSEFDDQPLVKSNLLLSVGSSLHQLGLMDSAKDPLERSLEIRRNALGDEHPKTLESIHHMGMWFSGRGKFTEADLFYREGLETSRRVHGKDNAETLNYINSLGSLLMKQGRLAEAEPLMRKALETARRVNGTQSIKNLAGINNLGSVLHMQGKTSEAEPILREALKISRNARGDEHPETLACISNLGALLFTQGKLPGAEVLFSEALETGRRVLGDEHPLTLNFINNMAAVDKAQGQHAEAEPLLRETLAASRRVLGDAHPSTLDSIDNLGSLLVAQAKLPEAELLYNEALATRRRLFGDEHPKTMVSMSSLGSLFQAQDKLAKAEPLYRQSLEISRRFLGDEHSNTLVYINNLASLLKNQGKLAESEPLYREALEASRRTLGDEHPDTLIYINNLGKLLKQQGKMPEAEPLYREALKTARIVLGDEHPNTLSYIRNLASLLKDQRKLPEAETLHREVLQTAKRVLGKDHPKTLSYIKNLASLLAKQGKLAEAVPFYREALTTSHRTLGEVHADTLSYAKNLGWLLQKQEKFSEAEPLLRECYEGRKKTLPDDHWLIADAQSMLGEAIAGQARFSEAESLLVESYEQMVLSVSSAARKTAALNRVIDLYVAWHKSEPNRGFDVKAQEWKEKNKPSESQ